MTKTSFKYFYEFIIKKYAVLSHKFVRFAYDKFWKTRRGILYEYFSNQLTNTVHGLNLTLVLTFKAVAYEAVIFVYTPIFNTFGAPELCNTRKNYSFNVFSIAGF